VLIDHRHDLPLGLEVLDALGLVLGRHLDEEALNLDLPLASGSQRSWAPTSPE
jgi:hypothetical protein